MDFRRENEEASDPDYEGIKADKVGEINACLHREDARDETVQKIQNIIREQFSFEMELKEREVKTINKRIHETRCLLDKLRACVLAGYYGYDQSSKGLPQENLGKRKTRAEEARSKQTCLSEIMKWQQSLPGNLKEQPSKDSVSNRDEVRLGMQRDSNGSQGKPQPTLRDNSQLNLGHLYSASPTVPSKLFSAENTPSSGTDSLSRFYVKRRIIVGNTSKFILPEHRESNDRSTHKWMVYVRGPKDNSELQNFISKVWFLLHPSYQPNDLVEVSKPPFQVTRRGWGEFPVRVQLHFVENKNKRVDIIHHLKLDKTYTGLQTLGAETHVDIELDRRNFDSQTSLNHLETADDVGRVSQSCVPHTSAMTTDYNLNNSSLFQEFMDQEMNDDHNDHSYSAPPTKQHGAQCDDNMSYPTPPVSLSSSRCPSPQLTKENHFPALSYESELCIRNSVKQFPLVNPDHSIAIPPYCAKTVQQFLKWNIGKRLAAEWQRSLAVRSHISSHSPTSAPSTKEVMNYCRFHGYTPMPDASPEVKYVCKMCVEEKRVDQGTGNEISSHDHRDTVSEILGSLSGSVDFWNHIDSDTSLSRDAGGTDARKLDDSDVDVVIVADELSEKRSQHSKLLFLPVSEELEWVQETTAAVNVHLQHANIDGVRAPVTTAMLYKACGLFIEDILRKANRFTWRTPSRIPKTKCILPVHVNKALKAIHHCDFLTNKYLGVVLPSTQE